MRTLLSESILFTLASLEAAVWGAIFVTVRWLDKHGWIGDGTPPDDDDDYDRPEA